MMLAMLALIVILVSGMLLVADECRTKVSLAAGFIMLSGVITFFVNFYRLTGAN